MLPGVQCNVGIRAYNPQLPAQVLMSALIIGVAGLLRFFDCGFSAALDTECSKSGREGPIVAILQ